MTLLLGRADLVKIRAQAMNPATGRPFYTYPSPWSALGTIYRTEGGIAGMYRCAHLHHCMFAWRTILCCCGLAACVLVITLPV